jgi:hypothetical protein
MRKETQINEKKKKEKERKFKNKMDSRNQELNMAFTNFTFQNPRPVFNIIPFVFNHEQIIFL